MRYSERSAARRAAAHAGAGHRLGAGAHAGHHGHQTALHFAQRLHQHAGFVGRPDLHVAGQVTSGHGTRHGGGDGGLAVLARAEVVILAADFDALSSALLSRQINWLRGRRGGGDPLRQSRQNTRTCFYHRNFQPVAFHLIKTVLIQFTGGMVQFCRQFYAGGACANNSDIQVFFWMLR